jgi:hypothetical protein
LLIADVRMSGFGDEPPSLFALASRPWRGPPPQEKSTSSRVEGGYDRPDLRLTVVMLVMLTRNCPRDPTGAFFD